MDVESVRSGRSMRSDHSQMDRMSGHAGSHSYRSRHSRSGHSRDRHRYRDHGSEIDTDREDRHSSHNRRQTTMAPQDVAVPIDMGNDRLEVQIIPQDDNWGETTTAVSGATSDTGFTMDEMARLNKDLEESIGFNCARYVGSVLAGILGGIAFLSPIVMVILPKTLGLKNGWQTEDCGVDCECGVECEGLFISFAFKLLILLIGSWALFFRKPRATMPRIYVFRALVLFLIFILTFAFWLFYGVRIYLTQEKNYYSIVLFASSFVDALLFVHYLAIILLEIRHLQPEFVVKIVRSPDGESRSYSIGLMSIQNCAVWCLEKYYQEFQVYNPYLEHVSSSRRQQKLTGFKVYDVDGMASQTPIAGSRAIIAAAARHRDLGHNERFYEEQEYERRVRKRKARLLVAAEEAFSHIKRLQDQQQGKFCYL